MILVDTGFTSHDFHLQTIMADKMELNLMSYSFKIFSVNF